MDRCVIKRQDGKNAIKLGFDLSNKWQMSTAQNGDRYISSSDIDKFAEYENTDLTPKEVAQLKQDNAELRELLKLMRKPY